MRIAIAIPPADQQQAIIRSCDDSTFELSRAMEAASREVSLIQELRIRLVADVVTGKLDVRAAAASLPEMTEFETADALPDDEESESDIDQAEAEELAA